MDYETIILSRDALQMALTLPNLPLEDRSRIELVIATIDLNKTLEKRNKRTLYYDEEGQLQER